MWFHTGGKNKGLGKEIIHQLANAQTDQNVKCFGQYDSAEIGTQKTGHGERDHDGPTNERTYVWDNVEKGTKERDDDGIFHAHDQECNGTSLEAKRPQSVYYSIMSHEQEMCQEARCGKT